MKKYLLLLLILPFLFFSCPDDDNIKPPDYGPTAAEFFAENNLTIGWNVGNSLDGKSENGWGNPRINRDLLNGVVAAGFNVLRIPITWHQDVDRPIGPAPDYKLNTTRLNRVAQVVDLAHNAGFKAVIINIHHDGAPVHSGDDGMYWLDMDGGAAVTAKFSKVWEQIAERFKDYDEWLIFEGMNEPNPNVAQGAPGRWGWNATDAQFNTINEWNQAFTDAVRGTGGKNTGRFLVIQPIYARAHVVMDPRFKLPNDPTPNKQIVSIHWYYPEPFSLYGTSFAWGTDADKSVIVNGSDNPNTGDVGFKHFKEKYTSQGIPVIIGECGATYQANRGADLAAANANRIAYLTYLCGQAKAHGLVPILWDSGGTPSGNNNNFGLFDREYGDPLPEAEEAIAAMVNAVKD